MTTQQHSIPTDIITWIQIKFEDVAAQFDIIRGEILKERENRQAIFDTRDKTHEERFREVNKLIEVQREIAEKATDAFLSLMEIRLAEVRNELGGVQRVMELMVSNYRTGHSEQHAIQEKAFDEFKAATNKRIEDTQRTIETVKEERQHYVLRESYDTQMATVTTAVDRVERQARDARTEMDHKLQQLIEARVKQITYTYDPKFLQIQERQTRMENGINVGNARNQQSIVALGLLLGIVEFLIRYLGR